MDGARDSEQVDSGELGLGVAETTSRTARMGTPGLDEGACNEAGKDFDMQRSSPSGSQLMTRDPKVVDPQSVTSKMKSVQIGTPSFRFLLKVVMPLEAGLESRSIRS